MHRHLLALVALGLLCTASARSADSLAGRAQEKAKMPNQGFLSVADEAFWRAGLDRSPVLNRMFREGFTGLALDAPGVVDLRARATLPLVGAAAATTKQGRGWSFQGHTVLVATEIDRFRGYVDMAAPIERPVRRPPSSDEPAPGQPEEGRFMEKATFDARARLKLPWEQATYQMVLLSRDWISNRVRVRLWDGPPPAPGAAEVPLPGGGIALAASGKGKTATLEAKLKVRARPGVLPAAPGGSDKVAIPMTLVITGHRQPVPYVKQISVPARWRAEPGLPEHVQGEIHATLEELVPHLPADTYYVYAFAGEGMGGPVRVPVESE